MFAIRLFYILFVLVVVLLSDFCSAILLPYGPFNVTTSTCRGNITSKWIPDKCSSTYQISVDELFNYIVPYKGKCSKMNKYGKVCNSESYEIDCSNYTLVYADVEYKYTIVENYHSSKCEMKKIENITSTISITDLSAYSDNLGYSISIIPDRTSRDRRYCVISTDRTRQVCGPSPQSFVDFLATVCKLNKHEWYEIDLFAQNYGLMYYDVLDFNEQALISHANYPKFDITGSSKINTKVNNIQISNAIEAESYKCDDTTCSVSILQEYSKFEEISITCGITQLSVNATRAFEKEALRFVTQCSTTIDQSCAICYDKLYGDRIVSNVYTPYIAKMETLSLVSPNSEAHDLNECRNLSWAGIFLFILFGILFLASVISLLGIAYVYYHKKRPKKVLLGETQTAQTKL